ncbi:MAG: MFS transporter [Thermoleophilia bacterium]|nr:MFS transporter [Thermoleophilia bacterium]
MTPGSPSAAAATSAGATRLAIAGLMVLALLGRLPLAMLNLGLLLLVRDQGNSYAVAGAVAGASTVAMGLAAPRIGRLADRVGAAPVLVGTGLVGMVTTATLGAVPERLGIAGITALAVVAGGATPPIATVFRASLPRLVGQDRLGQMYALEAACQELVYVVGPMLVLAIVAGADARAAVVVCGLLTGVVTAAFAAAVARHAAPPSATGRGGSVLANPRLRRILLAYLALGGTFGSIEVAAVAALEHLGERGASGVVLGAWAAGSFAGGVVVPRVWRASPARRLSALLVILALLGIPLAACALAGPWALGAALFAQGIAIAPTIGSVYELIPRITPENTLTEAFSWSIGSVVIGSSIGMALSGLATSHAGGAVAMTLAVLFPTVAALTFDPRGTRWRDVK